MIFMHKKNGLILLISSFATDIPYRNRVYWDSQTPQDIINQIGCMIYENDLEFIGWL